LSYYEADARMSMVCAAVDEQIVEDESYQLLSMLVYIFLAQHHFAEILFLERVVEVVLGQVAEVALVQVAKVVSVQVAEVVLE
jgi:hypothetical protein